MNSNTLEMGLICGFCVDVFYVWNRFWKNVFLKNSEIGFWLPTGLNKKLGDELSVEVFYLLVS